MIAAGAHPSEGAPQRLSPADQLQPLVLPQPSQT